MTAHYRNGPAESAIHTEMLLAPTLRRQRFRHYEKVTVWSALLALAVWCAHRAGSHFAFVAFLCAATYYLHRNYSFNSPAGTRSRGGRRTGLRTTGQPVLKGSDHEPTTPGSGNDPEFASSRGLRIVRPRFPDGFRIAIPAIPRHRPRSPSPFMTRSEAVSKSLNALLRADIETAVSISSNFSGGAGSLFDNETADIVRFILEHDYTPDASITGDVIAPLRVMAAAMELWDDFNLADHADVSGSWQHKHPPELVTRLLHAAGLQQHRLERMRQMGAREISIRSNRPSGHCPACQSDLGKTFAAAIAPLLPHPDCSCESACDCSYFAIPGPPLR